MINKEKDERVSGQERWWKMKVASKLEWMIMMMWKTMKTQVDEMTIQEMWAMKKEDKTNYCIKVG